MINLRFIFFVYCLISISFSYASSPLYLELADSADNYIKREKWIEAERCIIKALRLEPANFSNALLFSNLGLVQLSKVKFDDSLESFRLGLSISPKSTILLNNHAKVLMLKNDKENALLDLNLSLSIDSIQEWPRQMRGFINYDNKDFIAAKKDFETLLKAFPENQYGYFGLGLIYEIQEEKDLAEENYEKALDIEFNEDFFSHYILLIIKENKYSKAAELIRNAITQYPEIAELYIWRGYLHKLNYRNDEAQADKKTAINKGADINLVNSYIP